MMGTRRIISLDFVVYCLILVPSINIASVGFTAFLFLFFFVLFSFVFFCFLSLKIGRKQPKSTSQRANKGSMEWDLS